MPEELTRIELDPRNKAILELISRTVNRSASKTQEQNLVTVTNKLAKLALEAYQSKVPVDTFVLRDADLKILKRATQDSPYASVGTKDAIHTSRKGHKMASSLLAQMLNKGDYKRSRDSDAVDPYSSIGRKEPTKNWISSARLAFAVVRRNQ